MATIHAHEHAIRDIFSDKFAFSIPSYQRPYSWGTDQAGELFSDLLTASEGFSAGGPPPKGGVTPYFLGSIVLIKGEQAPDADVIDGQQRLTTLSLLLSALRVTFDDQRRKTTFSNLLLEEGDPLVGTHDRCRLTLRDRDHEFYEQNILRPESLSDLGILINESLPDPQRKLCENTALLIEKVASLDPHRREDLAAYLLQHTYLVVVATPDLDSAFRIFSVMNDRGLDLSAADILKAEIVGKITGPDRDKYVKAWEDAEEDLGIERFSELFSHIRMIFGRNKLRKTVLEGVRESVPLIKEPRKFITEELIPSAEAYEIILNHGYESNDRKTDKRINRLLGLLARMDDTDWIPPAIRFLKQNPGNPGETEKFFADLERLAMVMWLLRYDVNQRIRRHAEILAEIDANNPFASALQLTAEERSGAMDVLNGDIYTLSPPVKRKVILLRLDELLSSGEATYNHPLITIEHVLPQTPEPESVWCQWWPKENERKENVHRLGNLALLNRRQNSAARNWEFDQKKTKYFLGRSGVSPFALTTELATKETWTPTDFSERQARFVDRLAKEWSLNP
jgi:hypothetical protein